MCTGWAWLRFGIQAEIDDNCWTLDVPLVRDITKLKQRLNKLRCYKRRWNKSCATKRNTKIHHNSSSHPVSTITAVETVFDICANAVKWLTSTIKLSFAISKMSVKRNGTSCLRHVWLSKVLDEIIVVLGRFVLKEAEVDGVALDGGREVLGTTLQTTGRLRRQVVPLGRHEVYQRRWRLSLLLCPAARRRHTPIRRTVIRL